MHTLLDDFLTVGTLAPSLDMEVICDRSPTGYVVLSDQGILDLNAGRAFLLMWAEVVYKDIFGVQHATRYSQIFDGEDGHFHLTTFFNGMD